jgi:hypothetical protein
MERKYYTYNQGIAAYIMSRGYSIYRMFEGHNKAGRQVINMEFDVDQTTGRSLADEFYNGNAHGNLKDFHDKMSEVRKQLFEYRNK